LISIGTIAGVFSGLIAGKFSDNYGRKRFLVAGTAIYSTVFYLFAYLSKTFTTFFVLRFLAGTGFYVMPVLVAAMCADAFEPHERGRMMSLYSMGRGIGQLIGPPHGAFPNKRFGLNFVLSFLRYFCCNKLSRHDILSQGNVSYRVTL
jgi:DHA1 family multidrug resistance protein-like MFS transporter